MALKDKTDIVIESAVNAGITETQLAPIIPVGKTVRLMNFGGFDPITSDGVSGIISLQYGNATDGWKLIRCGGNGFFNIQWEKGKDFIGDGTKRFRIVRQNKSSNIKNIAAWVIALKID